MRSRVPLGPGKFHVVVLVHFKFCKYAKILAEIQDGAFFHMQDILDIRRNDLPIFINLCMGRRMGTNMWKPAVK